MFRQNQLASGILLVLGINFILVAIGFILSIIFEQTSNTSSTNLGLLLIIVPFCWLIGLGQFLYIIPLIIWLARQRQGESIKGVIIGAVITILLNGGGCFLLSNSLKF